MLRAGRVFLIALLLSLVVAVLVHNWWRTFVLDTGIWFLCWGVLGSFLRRPVLLVGCVITGFGVGMFSHHPIVGSMLGAVIALAAWGRLPGRRPRLKETT